VPLAWAWDAVNLRVIWERTMDNSTYTKRADSNGRHVTAPIHFDDAAERPDAAGANRQALERVRELIASEQMNASGRLPAERTLADNLGVSRRALRHALDVLEAEGRITRQQGRGTFVTDMRLATENLVHELSKLTNPVDTLEARLAIEPPQARLAALRATRGDIDKLFEAAEASRLAKDPASYEKADAAFHRRVSAAARNPLLIAIFDAVLETSLEGSWRHGRETAHCINNQANYAADHRRIAIAIAERNPGRAEEAMRAHLSTVQQRLIEHAFPRSAVVE
jgi:DNA-binding FadR family transcriptional regulator